MNIFLVGATGFVGVALTQHLLTKGHQVSTLVRSMNRAAALPAAATIVSGDPTRPGPWQQTAAASDVIINLAGASIFTRWSETTKRIILESRVLSTRNLVAALATVDPTTPRTLINTSATGYYGYVDDGLKSEKSPPGRDFLAEVCQTWEREAMAAQNLGHRVVITRLGVVLGGDGGALGKMLPAFRLGLGGRLGSGEQGFPWIHLADLLEIYSFLIERPDISGPVNCTAPQPVNNAEFTRALGRALHRPALLPVPGFLLHLLLGEMSSMLLRGCRVKPEILEAQGFSFRFPRIDQALDDLVG
ncbi:MAG TPA: TIGR01777 family protein [Desulfurivibrio alkaliphilus]|uniref:TIGR01777 family protein n=1 Tax=Desulfurivibrio alkaliphilus TaxID=427923 RepID=A0A7C2TMQ2_9BACT|nr:TIGR01777 family protein [Desulfurivibrio alkaliphilus]